MIFPIEGFQFCWSPRVVDLFDWTKDSGYLGLSVNEFVDALAKMDYQDWDFAAAVDSGNEVMVACRSYHAFMASGLDEERALLAALGVPDKT